MKVAHVVIGGDLAGGQRVALALIRALRARGDSGLIVSPFRGRFTDVVEAEGIPVHIVDVSRLYRLGGLRRLRRLLLQSQVDLVHTHGMTASNVLVRIAARSAHTPVVTHVHGPNVYRRNPVAAWTYRALDRVTSRWSAAILVVSDHTGDALVAQGTPAELIEVVPNGLDPPAEISPALLTVPENTQLVVSVGRLEPTKGQADLVTALPLLPGATLVLVGRNVDGYAETIECLASRLGVADRVILTGERDDVLSLMAAAEVVAVASTVEAFPLVPLEAMAVSRPVVATRVGGVPEIVVDGETGILVEPGRPDELATALGRLLSDKALAQRLGTAGRARLEREFPVARMVERVFGAYERALRGRFVQSRS